MSCKDRCSSQYLDLVVGENQDAVLEDMESSAEGAPIACGVEDMEERRGVAANNVQCPSGQL